LGEIIPAGEQKAILDARSNQVLATLPTDSTSQRAQTLCNPLLSVAPWMARKAVDAGNPFIYVHLVGKDPGNDCKVW
jgi:hypothetical protein